VTSKVGPSKSNSLLIILFELNGLNVLNALNALNALNVHQNLQGITTTIVIIMRVNLAVVEEEVVAVAVMLALRLEEGEIAAGL